jgi:hypothetical protein
MFDDNGFILGGYGEDVPLVQPENAVGIDASGGPIRRGVEAGGGNMTAGGIPPWPAGGDGFTSPNVGGTQRGAYGATMTPQQYAEQLAAQNQRAGGGGGGAANIINAVAQGVNTFVAGGGFAPGAQQNPSRRAAGTGIARRPYQPSAVSLPPESMVPTWAWWLGGGLALAAVAGGGYYFWRRSR